MTAQIQIREAALDVINAREMARETRPTRMVASTFTVWRALDGGKAQPETTNATSLIEIERTIATELNHGATFLVRETATISGRATLHTYRVRKGKAMAWGADAKRTYRWVADRLFSVEVTAFAPVEPWRWSPGCDVIGQSNFIEGGR